MGLRVADSYLQQRTSGRLFSAFAAYRRSATMDLRTASERDESDNPYHPRGRLHAYAPGMIQTLCGFSLVGWAIPRRTIRWGENPDGLSLCGECSNVAAALQASASTASVAVNSLGPVSVSFQQRVQFAVLLQFAEHGTADRATTAAICPGTGARDLEVALETLIDEGSIEGSVLPRETLAEAAGAGWLVVTALGRLRLDEDGV